MLGVSKSGYYRSCKQGRSTRSQRNKELTILIKEIHRESKERYGSPRIHAELDARGISCGRHRVARLMHLAKIKGKVHRRKRWNPCVHYDYPQSEDHLKRNFVVDKPNKVWVSDITYIQSKEGWVYLVVILDLFSRKVVGYSITNHMRSEIVIEAFENAFAIRRPGKGLIFHSDRGMQYICDSFQGKLKSYGIISSMSRKGNCFDNAVAESFFHTLKTELLERNSRYQTMNEARKDIFEYIFNFYNNKRRHSYLEYKTPMEFEGLYSEA